MRKYFKNVIKMTLKQNSIILFFCLSMFTTNVYGQTIDQQHTTITPQYSSSEIQDCKQRLITKGEMNDYACILFSKRKNVSQDYYELLIPYALIFANRYNNANACYHIYFYTKKLYEQYNLDMDSVTSAFIMSYLEKGAQLNDSSCFFELSRIYEEGVLVPQDSVKAAEYKKRYKALLP